ncbi:MAG: hypothetical protein D6739_11355, partial [Nitrospirae bacterium]
LEVVEVTGAAAWRRDGGGPLLIIRPGEAVTVRYRGTLFDPPRPSGHIRFVAGDLTGGTIGPEGVFLDAGSGWYPDPGGMALFDLDLTLPAPLVAVSQGRLAGREGGTSRWHATLAADGLAVVAAPYHVYHRRAGGVELGCYLRREDPETARLLLTAAAADIARLAARLGPYPYPRFDVVENFFTSGYGFPGFALLGPRVIAMGRRLLRPGYLDHEIGHNWWGNGVFVEPAGGNWCEALTTYCTNYLATEAQGAAAARRARLRWSERYAIDVPPERDYPLRHFRSKWSRVDDAVGYAKGAALLHQVRRRLGDDRFFAALRRFAAGHLGRRATWRALRAAFEAEAGEDLRPLFRPWLDRTGAPALGIAQARAVARGDGWRLTARVENRGLVVPLDLDYAVETEAGVVRGRTRITGAAAEFAVDCPARPRRLRLDPDRHLFLRLTLAQVTPGLEALMARPPRYYVVAEDDLPVYRELAQMARREFGGEVVALGEVGRLPCEANLWLLGRAALDPATAPLRAGAPQGLRFTAAGVALGAAPGPETALLATWPRPGHPGRFLGLYWAASEAAAARARYCFYYGSDSAVRFEAGRPVERRTWPPAADPLSAPVEVGR